MSFSLELHYFYLDQRHFFFVCVDVLNQMR